MCRSEPQIPVASTRTIASSGEPISGSGFSVIRTSPGDSKVTARIPASLATAPRSARPPQSKTISARVARPSAIPAPVSAAIAPCEAAEKRPVRSASITWRDRALP